MGVFQKKAFTFYRA